MTPVEEAASRFREAEAAKKCWSCGCLHQSLASVRKAFPSDTGAKGLDEALRAAGDRLTPVRYDCLGCEVCYPALAVNALNQAGHAVAMEPCGTAEPREGWPSLPGDYSVLRYRAPVAVCTLTDQALARDLAKASPPQAAIVGTLQTENLGIERLLLNLLADPHIRFLVVCGADSRQAVGHLPGQSLLALALNGLDPQGRIPGAPGRRPVLGNLPEGAVAHFRQSVEVVDLVGETGMPRILDAVARCAARDPGPARAFEGVRGVVPVRGHPPARMTQDPAGYFVVYPDRRRCLLSLEHYRGDGILDAVIEGQSAGEVYTPAVEKGLLSRLDHAAYLGRELARAEQALASGGTYVQDAAPEEGLPKQAPAVRKGRLPRLLLPLGTFLGTALAHFAWINLFPEACPPGESCGPCAPETASWWGRYVGTQGYWLGFSYGLSLAFAAYAFRKFREDRLRSARNAAWGGLTLSGILAVSGCWLVGCCGSPMLGVYLGLFGAAFLPFAKPLVAGVTVLSVAGTWFWMRRRGRGGAACGPGACGCSEGEPPLAQPVEGGPARAGHGRGAAVPLHPGNQEAPGDRIPGVA